jgi:hypothetical protein
MQTQVLTQNIPSSSIGDGLNPQLLGGKAGEGIVAELHGKYYTSTYRGKTFLGSTAAAGTVIPISSATAATFVLYNPIGSGVNIELISANVAILNATTVVSSIALGIASGLIVAPTSVTKLTPIAGLLGGSAVAQAQLYSVATIVATTTFFPLFSVSATAGAFSNFNYKFDGEIVLAPGSLVHLCGTAAQSSASMNAFSWSEWPL